MSAIPADTEAMLRTYLRYAEDPKANADLFHSWEWLQTLAERWPDEAWPAFRWLAAAAPSTAVLETIGCGPLLDFLWQHPQITEQFLEAAHTDRNFYLAARWCELDEEDVGPEQAQSFAERLRSSPFASNEA